MYGASQGTRQRASKRANRNAFQPASYVCVQHPPPLRGGEEPTRRGYGDTVTVFQDFRRYTPLRMSG